MRIDDLHIQNFASLDDIRLTDLPDLLVFVGKNSSGKSNIVNALSLLFLRLDNQLSQNLGNRDDYHHLFPNHDTRVGLFPTVSATMTLTTREWEELLQVEFEPRERFEKYKLHVTKRIVDVGNSIVWRTEEVDIGAFEIIYEGEFVSESPLITYEILTEDEESEEMHIEIDTSEFTNQLYQLLSSAMQVIYTTDNPRSWPNQFQERPTIIDNDHINSLWELSQSRGSRRQSWTRVTQQYALIAPSQQRPAGVASSIQMEEGNLSVPIGMTGEGSQAILRLIDQLERGTSIMAIEEPETHLHPGLIKRVGQLLTKSTETGKQLFICTHSPFLVEQSSLGSFFVVRKQGGKTRVSQTRENQDVKNLLYELGMRPSDILFCDALLLVEGLADEVFFDSISNKVNASLAERHVKIVRANGKDRGKYKIEFWAEVGEDAGLPLYLILDRNAKKEAQEAIDKNMIPEDHCLILSEGDLEDHYPWFPL